MKSYRQNRLFSWLPSGRWMEVFMLLTVIGTIVLPIAYSGVQSYDPQISFSRGYTDQELYIQNLNYIENGQWPKVGLSRSLTPYLASFIPSKAKVFFSRDQEFTQARLAALKFTVVNLIFLFATAALLYVFQKLIGLNAIESIFGVIVFLTAPFIVRMMAIPNYDIALQFFILLGCLGILLKNPFLYFMGLGLGVFAGEAILILVPLALFVSIGWKEKMKLIIPAGIVLCFYMLFVNKSTMLCVDSSILNKILLIPTNIYQMIVTEGFFRVIAVKLLLLSFGAGWIPALWAIFNSQKSAFLWRWWWLIPLAIAGMFSVHAYYPLVSFGIGRHLLVVFPLVCPLAGIGIYDMLVRIEKRF